MYHVFITCHVAVHQQSLSRRRQRQRRLEYTVGFGAHLQDTVDRQHQDYKDSLELQQKQFYETLERLQTRFDDSLAQQQKQLAKLEEGMYYIVKIPPFRPLSRPLCRLCP